MTLKDKFCIGLNVILVPLILYITIVGYLSYSSLSKNKEFARAVITNFSTIKNRNYLEYIFLLDTTVYEGEGRYFPRKDSFVIGDTIVIVYDKTNPKNNRPWRDL